MAMLLNTREWLRAGSLATIALICGLALRTPKQGDAAESAPPSRSSITDLSDAFASVAQHVKPAVVLVQSQLGGEPVESTPQLQERVGFKRAGETVAVTLVRQGGETKTVRLRLARAPSDIKPDGDPIYHGGTFDPVMVEARRDPTPVK